MYIVEQNAFPTEIVAVPTAIPVFIGYTENAKDTNGKSLTGVPFKISSISDYEENFGKGFKSKFKVNKDSSTSTVSVEIKPDTKAYLYDSIRIFYANGGGSCYIVSVGCHAGLETLSITLADLIAPLDTDKGCLVKEPEPTLVVVPDAVGLNDADCCNVYNAVLAHCNTMQSRMGIFDTPKTDAAFTNFDGFITNFRQALRMDFLKYGAVYFPWINTNIVREATEIDLNSLDIDKSNIDGFAKIFIEKAVPKVLQNYLKQ